MLKMLQFMFLSALVCVAGYTCGQASELNKLDGGNLQVLNICKAPYFADPKGKQDCTEAILRALDDVTRATQ